MLYNVTFVESTAGEDSVSFSKAGLYVTSHWGFPNCPCILLSQPQEQSHLIHDEDGGVGLGDNIKRPCVLHPVLIVHSQVVSSFTGTMRAI